MRFICNGIHPAKVGSQHISIRTGETPQQALNRYIKWANQFEIGEPMSTDTYSSAELKRMGMVGFYSKD